MIATTEIEVLPDDEYALWEQAVTSAEQQRADRSLIRVLQPEALVQQYPGAPDHEAVDQAVASIAEDSLPDLEDFGAKVNRRAKYRPGGLRVTDITSAEWCQQQVAFTLSAHLPKEATETAAMAAGTAVHAALEAELSTAVEVAVSTVEDGWAVRLVDMMSGLHQLREEGVTREMYIWGNVQGQWVRGIIDQLELHDNGRIRVVEHKTRRKPSLPMLAQQQTAKLQVMTYKLLLDLLPKTCSLAQLTKFFHLLHLDLMRPLSDTVQQHAKAMGVLPDGAQPATLTFIAEQLQQQISYMPQSSTHVKVCYIWQADSEVLGETDYEYDHAWVVFKLKQHIDFWEGIWTPQVVPAQESWKCRHCLFCQTCPVGLDVHKC
ncbi:hypothetical protein WJX77_004893 [Trebouxia sp. C0004]